MQNDLMVASDLQRGLLAEIGEVLKDLITEVNGEVRTGYNGYCQYLPKAIENDEDPDGHFPYYIVRLIDGTTPDDNNPWTVTVDIFLGVCDTGEENQGHFHVLEAIQRIVNRFSFEATIGNQGRKAFRCHSDMSWGLQDSDAWPYYFGVVELKFTVPKPGRKDPYGW